MLGCSRSSGSEVEAELTVAQSGTGPLDSKISVSQDDLACWSASSFAPALSSGASQTRVPDTRSAAGPGETEAAPLPIPVQGSHAEAAPSSVPAPSQATSAFVRLPASPHYSLLREVGATAATAGLATPSGARHTFTRVFERSASCHHMYEACCSDLVESVYQTRTSALLLGLNGADGATDAVMGFAGVPSSVDSAGFLLRAAVHLLDACSGPEGGTNPWQLGCRIVSARSGSLTDLLAAQRPLGKPGQAALAPIASLKDLLSILRGGILASSNLDEPGLVLASLVLAPPDKACSPFGVHFLSVPSSSLARAPWAGHRDVSPLRALLKAAGLPGGALPVDIEAAAPAVCIACLPSEVADAECMLAAMNWLGLEVAGATASPAEAPRTGTPGALKRPRVPPLALAAPRRGAVAGGTPAAQRDGGAVGRTPSGDAAHAATPCPPAAPGDDEAEALSVLQAAVSAWAAAPRARLLDVLTRDEVWEAMGAYRAKRRAGAGGVGGGPGAGAQPATALAPHTARGPGDPSAPRPAALGSGDILAALERSVGAAGHGAGEWLDGLAAAADLNTARALPTLRERYDTGRGPAGGPVAIQEEAAGPAPAKARKTLFRRALYALRLGRRGAAQ
ncbi:hypothetical protein ACKKBF_B09815 [Auxenochlorella protothecoides x Auxenochlorella symbiontica]